MIMENLGLTLFAVALGLMPLLVCMVTVEVLKRLGKIDDGEKVIQWYEMRNYRTHKTLDNMLNKCMDSGIMSMSYNESGFICDGKCEFGNGVVYRFWDRNIPYAWLSRGEFIKGDETIYRYDSAMPSKRTMNRFYDMIFENINKC